MIFRYPGGKGKLSKRLVSVISKHFENQNPKDLIQYREPFFGAGAIGLRLLESPFVRWALFNDFDPAICHVWRAVAWWHWELLKRIDAFTPSTEAFYEFKALLLSLDKISGNPPELWAQADIAFKKIAVHQLSYSGLGTKSGGPLGGVDQKSDYKIDCRWSPNQLRKEILRIQQLIQSKRDRFGHAWVEIKNVDFSEIILQNGPCFIYLDPPYYVKGPELYQYSFKHEDHVRLANDLESQKNPWLLSYDDCPEVRTLYEFAVVKVVPLNYTINGATTKNELLIAPKGYEHLLVDLEEKKPFDMFEGEYEG